MPADQRRFVDLYFTVRGRTVTLIEERPTFWDADEWTDTPVAQLRYDSREGRWTLFCADAHARWHPYPGAESSKDIDELLREIDADPTGIFWG